MPHLTFMKTKLPLFILIFLFAATTQAQSAPDPSTWKRYTVEDEEFSVTLPALPSMTSIKVYRQRIEKLTRERVLATSANGVIYSVYVCANPKPQQSLEEFIKEQTVKSQLDLTTERTLSLNGFAGKEYSSLDKTKPATEQFFATDKYLFRFVGNGPAQHAGIKQFFSSIQLGKNAEGIAVMDGPGNPLEPALETVFTGKEVHRKARLISKPEPTYTSKAESERTTGTVVLRAVFSHTGNVIDIKTLVDLPHGLTERAIEAARQIKFIPAMKDGRYVSMWIQLEYNFNL